MRARVALGSAVLAVVVSVLIYWFALHQVSVIFSIAAIGYPQDLGYVAVNFVLIALFVLLVGFRRRLARLPASIYVAFVVALYVEMYGFPLTMYFFSWAFGAGSVATLWYLLAGLTGEALFVSVFMGVIVPVSNVIVVAGILLVVFGWVRIFRARQRLVTTGLYGCVRHPQYLGFLLITLGMNVLWVTLTTLALWPVLALLYVRLAREEDKLLEERFGEEFVEYKNSVPSFLPRLWNPARLSSISMTAVWLS
jgi:methanethiol S-methyltransferase